MEKTPILQFFAYGHLPEALQKVSKPFHDLAHELCEDDDECGTTALLPNNNSERAVALRKLLEAKDAAVRSLFMKV